MTAIRKTRAQEHADAFVKQKSFDPYTSQQAALYTMAKKWAWTDWKSWTLLPAAHSALLASNNKVIDTTE